MLNIASFTFKFDRIEDRILLVGNLDNHESRVDFWLTRSLILRLLRCSQELVEKTSSNIQNAPAQHKSQMAQFDHEHARQNAALERESKEVLPSNADLITRIDISCREEAYRLLFFTTGDQPYASSTLSYEELHQVLHLMHRGAIKLDWGVPEELFETTASSATLQ